MLKVMTLIGTRPEIIKLSCVMRELDRCTRHVVVHSGQNYDYELNQIFFDGLQLRRPDHFLNVAGGSLAETIANVIVRSDQVFVQERPDALLLLGDTNSCLAVLPAKRRKIPIFHMEAGNRCFDQRVPEELNRKVVDHLSDINLPYTEHARRYLLAEGLRPETVIKTGSPMKEVIDSQRDMIERSKVLSELGLIERRFFVVSAHREENVDDDMRLAKLLDILAALAERYRFPVIVSTHPRTRARIDALGRRDLPGDVRFMKPLGFADYIRLQTTAFCVVSDSGTITEEASLLDFPAVMIRDAHERPEGMDEGTLVMAGLNLDRILDAVSVLTNRIDIGGRFSRVVGDYDIDRVSTKIANIILSYTDYVNRTVWSKETGSPG